MAFHVVYSPWSASLEGIDSAKIALLYCLTISPCIMFTFYNFMGEKIIVHKTFIWNDFAGVSFSSLYTPGMKSTSYYHHMKISLLIMFCEHLLMLLPKVASCSFDLSAYRHLFAKPTNLVIISLWLCMISLWYIIANE